MEEKNCGENTTSRGEVDLEHLVMKWEGLCWRMEGGRGYCVDVDGPRDES